MVIKKRKGFTLTELLIAVALSGLIILAVSSVDFSSRRFFEAIKNKVQIQTEAAIAMEHIVKNLQLGIGDMSNPGTFGSPPDANNSRGFYILDPLSQLATGGGRIEIKLDDDGDGKFDSGTDRRISYVWHSSRRIRYDPNADAGGPGEFITDRVIFDCSFSIDGASNRVNITIIARSKPTQAVSLDNPETILTSSVALRAMSIN